MSTWRMMTLIQAMVLRGCCWCFDGSIWMATASLVYGEGRKRFIGQRARAGDKQNAMLRWVTRIMMHWCRRQGRQHAEAGNEEERMDVYHMVAEF